MLAVMMNHGIFRSPTGGEGRPSSPTYCSLKLDSCGGDCPAEALGGVEMQMKGKFWDLQACDSAGKQSTLDRVSVATGTRRQ